MARYKNPTEQALDKAMHKIITSEKKAKCRKAIELCESHGYIVTHHQKRAWTIHNPKTHTSVLTGPVPKMDTQLPHGYYFSWITMDTKMNIPSFLDKHSLRKIEPCVDNYAKELLHQSYKLREFIRYHKKKILDIEDAIDLKSTAKKLGPQYLYNNGLSGKDESILRDMLQHENNTVYAAKTLLNKPYGNKNCTLKQYAMEISDFLNKVR